MEYLPSDLGAVIRTRREALGWSQEKLGTEAGYGAGAGVSISRIENGLSEPRPDRLDSLAEALNVTTDKLKAESAARHAESDHEAPPSPEGQERLKDRAKRVQLEIEHRTHTVEQLIDAFNDAHDRARDDFFMEFVQIAQEIEGAPVPDKGDLEFDDEDTAETEADLRIRLTQFGIRNELSKTAGAAALGALSGGAVGGAAAYGTFIAAVTYGSASTGIAISSLSGVAASNAALALLGGGTLAAGGAGIAGGTAVLTGIVAAPTLIFTVGTLVWMARRNRKQQLQLIEYLNQLETELNETAEGFSAITEILPRATKTLDDIAVFGGRALQKWQHQMVDAPKSWEALAVEQRAGYDRFIEIATSQLAVVAIDVQGIVMECGEDPETAAKRAKLIALADAVLTEAQRVVDEHV